MIAIIRITGQVNKDRDLEETLSRLKIRKKYACTLIDGDKKEIIGMVKKVRNFVAYGNLDKDNLVELIKKRGQPVDKKAKIDAEKEAELILKNKGFDKSNIKPFFRLHPPRGGINTKTHYPKGVLGDHKDKLNELLSRML